MSFSFDFVKSQSESALERFAVENGNRSGGRGSGRPRRMSLKTTLFRRNDGSAAFEIGQFQKQNALDDASSAKRGLVLEHFRFDHALPPAEQTVAAKV